MLNEVKRVVVTPPMLADMPEAFAPLEARGLDVCINDEIYPMNAPKLATFIGDAEVAIVGLDMISAEVFDLCSRLGMVARNGVGMDNVDLDAANHHDVLITAPLGANSTSVAELVMGLMITLVRGVIPNHNRVQAGVWQRVAGVELAGKTLGIIGLGRIGKKVARRAQAFNMRVIAQDIAPDHYFARENQIQFMERETLLQESDVVSLHVPLTPLTFHMINRDTLGQMKPGAFLVNTARGSVVDGDALVDALERGHLNGAALDVHPLEGSIEPVLKNRSDVITTTHLGAYTHDSLRYTTEMAVDSIIQVLDNQQPDGLMNPEVWHNHRNSRR